MPATLEDFLSSFTGGGTPDTQQATELHDRFVSTHENDRQFDNEAYGEGATEYLEKLPDDQFHDAARAAISQAPPQQREDLLGGLLSSLAGGAPNRNGGGLGGGAGVPEILSGLAGGAGIGALVKMLGLGTADPKRMSEDDAAKVINYARKENPEALRQTVQDKPWFLKALGNPIVMGALTMAATRLLSRARR